jgi:hypothetical protein
MSSKDLVGNPIVKTKNDNNDIIEKKHEYELPMERIYQTEVDLLYSFNKKKNWYENMNQYIKETPYFCPEEFTLNFMDNHYHKENILNNYIEIERTFQLNFIQRIFVTFQFPNASLFSTIWLYFIRLLILVFISNSVLATIPPFQQHPDTCGDNLQCNSSLTNCLCPPIAIDLLTQLNFFCVVGNNYLSI